MIKTRAKSAAGRRSHAAAKRRQLLDRKIRSTDSDRQSTMTQLQRRWSLPFTNRHHGSLLPQFDVSAVGGSAVVSCVRGAGGHAVASRRTMMRRHRMVRRHIAPEPVFEASSARGDSGACWDAAKQQCKSALVQGLRKGPWTRGAAERGTVV